MKFFIVLFAVVAAASAGYIESYHEPIAQPWVAPAAPLVHSPVVHGPVVHAPLPWVAPKYVKVAAPVAYPKVHHVLNIQQAPAIPALHPHPLNIKTPHHQVTRLHYSGPHVSHPHLVGVEHYAPAPEPAITVVKAHGHGHGWD